MDILAHRGHWTTPLEKNSRAAFERALSAGFGLETDLRDAHGSVVIAHDLPRGGEMPLDDFLTLCTAYPARGALALNIKADGLQDLVQAALARHAITNSFVFDMAVPDARGYFKRGITAYTRCSEFENPPPCLAQAAGVWLDAFISEWYGPALVAQLLAQGKAVCIVSPELHGRPHLALWQSLHASGLHTHTGLSLCTDLPREAQEMFHVQN
jgi:hypothetical protein